MKVNITGTWIGKITGTNSGEMALHLQHEEDRIYGLGRFYEPQYGAYEYEIQGISKEAQYSFFLTPRPNQSVQLGTIQATCKLDTKGQMLGKWASSIGTTGSFNARKKSQSQEHEVVESRGAAVFLIHGHDEATKEKVARFLEKLEVAVVILHEQANRGMTIIEKFEKHASRAKFAIALFTPDDIGYPLGAEERKQPRARQNVLLEMGYFIGRLGRENVSILYKGGVELPSDIFGVAYSQIDDTEGWKLAIAKELKDAGYIMDLNRVFA